jgi:8-oxo-dGTP pyrophosphatase MutT (NUDIX family)
MKSTIKFFRPLIILVFRSWWFVTCPTTAGSKVILVHGDEILLIKTTYGYNYTLPGGLIDKGETPEHAAIREVWEEVGIKLTHVTTLPSFITYEEYKTDTVHGFYTEVPNKEYKLDKIEIDTAEWHHINNLPKLGSVTERIVQLYKNK